LLRTVPADERSPAPAPQGVAATGTVFIETFGCQMNVADSELMAGQLSGAGYAVTASEAASDVVVLNTCAIRDKAEERVLRRLEQLAALKRQRPELVIAVTGCMAEHLKGALAQEAPCVDIVAGPDSYRRFADLVDTVRSAKAAERAAALDFTRYDEAHPPTPLGVVVDVRLDRTETYEGLDGARGGDGISGFVTIQRGCDKFCTFCVVPFTRGRERGTPPREVLRQVRALAEAGYKEVTLLGQTVNSYRHEDVTFAQLLRAVARVDGIERVRFTSPYPVDFTDDVIDVLASEPKVCKHVHLPLQSASDAVLERMGRGYTAVQFEALAARLRQRVAGVALTTDVIVGFSGETESDHQLTVEALERLRFDSAFLFAYSERELTQSAKRLPDDVPPEVKQRRLTEVIAVQDRVSSELHRAEVGRVKRVLIAGPSKRSELHWLGRADNFKAVVLPRGSWRPGELVDVRIVDTTSATLIGQPISHH
jgi:tRNA-2-methylthio-N6-dimethylallyladenosine synthase